MRKDKRKRVRRTSDRILDEIITFLGGVEQAYVDETIELGGQLEKIRKMIPLFGRRDEDRLRGQQLVSISERLLRKVTGEPTSEKQPRKVQIQKVSGKQDARVAVGEARVGWEADEPEAGKRYTLYMDDGSIYKTGTVTRVEKSGFQTSNSTYTLEVLEVKKGKVPKEEGP